MHLERVSREERTALVRACFQEGEAVYSTANLASYMEQKLGDVAWIENLFQCSHSLNLEKILRIQA